MKYRITIITLLIIAIVALFCFSGCSQKTMSDEEILERAIELLEESETENDTAYEVLEPTPEPTQAPTPEPSSTLDPEEYLIPESNTSFINLDELGDDLNNPDFLELAASEILARHGYTFTGTGYKLEMTDDGYGIVQMKHFSDVFNYEFDGTKSTGTAHWGLDDFIITLIDANEFHMDSEDEHLIFTRSE